LNADFQKNILVDEGGYARLSDFSRAKVIGEAGYATALVAGSAPYMAPELFPFTEAEVEVDELFSKQSDVYAFAMVCFEVSYAYCCL
jgi:serine/threonine protein kinase